MGDMNKYSEDNRRQVRFGIICNRRTLSEFQARCLRKLVALDNVMPVLVLEEDNSLKETFNWRVIKWGNLRNLLWNIFYMLIVTRNSRALRAVDVNSILTDLPSVRCKAMKSAGYVQCLDESDTADIRKYNPDFILHFGSNIICSEIINAARFGIWSFLYGPEGSFLEGPPGFWEIYNSSSATGAVLRCWGYKLDKKTILKKGYFKTNNSSYVRNLDEILFKSSEWPSEVCVDIQNGNVEHFSQRPSKEMTPLVSVPNNVQMLFFFLKLANNLFRKLYRILFASGTLWNVGVIYNPIHVFLTPGVRPEVKWFPAPERREEINADPFAVSNASKVHFFYESFNYRSCKGYISTRRYDGNSFSQSRVAIRTPFHMSYPYLLEYNGETYCIPEESESNEVSLYKAVSFPDNWEKTATLISGFSGVDNTVFQYNGYWWLMATDADDGPMYNLKLWYAKDLLGPWKQHMKNSVKMDVRSSRPAGTPFTHNGCLYRPAQDCSENYGGRIVINKVTRLTTAEFEEEQVSAIEPFKNSPYPDGIHTVSAAGDITVIDGKKNVFVGANIYMLKYKIRNTYDESIKKN